MTTTSPSLISLFIIAALAASSPSNTRAGPWWTSISGATAACLTIAPSGARVPLMKASPPSLWCGLSSGRITSGSEIFAFATFSAVVWPVTVIVSPWMRPASSSSCMRAWTPPARQRSSMWCAPPGLMEQRCGTFSPISLKRSRDISRPAAHAIAGRWSDVLVEPPSARSTATALRKASIVRMSRGRMFLFTMSMTARPASFARRMRPACTAGTVPLPGRARPSTSIMQFIVLAVNMPEQEPQPGQALSSISWRAASSILPAERMPTPSNTLLRSRTLPLFCPAIIGPPDMTTEGRLSSAAAIAMPGTILSQFGTRTSPSKACARAMTSMESMMSSRLARENFIPSWFIAIPSHTPMTGNSIGSPPAA